MSKFMSLFAKRIWLCTIFFGVVMPSKAAGRFSEFTEKLESLPYGLGMLIVIFMFFVLILSYAYDYKDKESKSYGRWIGLVIFVVLYIVVVRLL
jgi:hypothetical protein